MRPFRHSRIALVVAVAVAAIAAGAGQATSTRSAWSRISGPTQPGVQLGLARGADGVLHVVWNRGTTPTSIFETRVSPAGKAIGTSTVASGFDGNGGLALLVMPDKTLRLFAAGGVHPGSSMDGIVNFTAPASGGSWSLQAGTLWGGAVANASGVIGATLTKDGQPVTAWRGFAAEGLQPNVPPSAYEGGMTESFVATDAATGGVVLSGVTNAGKGGVYVQQVLPTRGSAVVLPLAYALNDWNSSLSGRIGAPGVYVAYADAKAVRLYRYGGGAKTMAHGAYTSAAACPAPEGRLWVAWGDKTGSLSVTRSNRAVSAFEPIQHLTLAQGKDGMTFLQCEGSTGPVDLFADVQFGGAPGFWHTHLLAQLSLRVNATRAKVTVLVRDAGDPVVGAAITVGGKHLKTDAKGQATLKLKPGSYSASATASGYARASVKFTLR